MRNWPTRSKKILEPFMRGCAAEGIDYRGILYPGVMLDEERAEGSGVQRAVRRSGNAGLPDPAGKRSRRAAGREHQRHARQSGIEMESAGQRLCGDGQRRISRKLRERQGDLRPRRCERVPEHESISRRHREGRGRHRHERRPRAGRDGAGQGFESAQTAAYAAAEKIQFEGAQFRRDIAAKALQM